ncbi:MAG: hypothetical protein Q8R55_03145 [Candidatus Taylorbacteria bacterium]|nr:hypothetical protein [Candidatus Taylorbacteria bacterium]
MPERENPLGKFRSWIEQKMRQKQLIRFEHMGQTFTVRKDNKGTTAALDVLNKHGTLHGIIRGQWIETDKEIEFFSMAVKNIHKGQDSHIPLLIQTAIGEIVAQIGERPGKNLRWHSSDIFLTDDGRKMYQRLMEEANTPGNRFYKRIHVETIPKEITSQFVISPHPVN